MYTTYVRTNFLFNWITFSKTSSESARESTYPGTELTHPGLSGNEEKEMDDGLVLNIATDSPVPAKHTFSKKSGRWTDR
jgi:hypothetical protein